MDANENFQHLGDLPIRRIANSFNEQMTILMPKGIDKTIRINGLEKSKNQI